MKSTFGNPLHRILHGGVRLRPVERKLLAAFLDRLPAPIRSTVSGQLDRYNLVQRENDGRALNFYRLRFGRATVDGLPLLICKATETRLLALKFRIDGSERAFDAGFWSVGGRFFCINFSDDLRSLPGSADIEIVDIRESWRGNVTASVC